MTASHPEVPSRMPIEWTFNPWRRDLRRAAVAVAAWLLLGVVMSQLGLATMTLAILMLAFLATLHPAVAIQRCRVDDAGVARRLLFVWEHRPWERIGRAQVDQAGLWVWGSANPGRFETVFRGLWLPVMPDERRADLLSALRERLGAHGF